MTKVEQLPAHQTTSVVDGHDIAYEARQQTQDESIWVKISGGENGQSLNKCLLLIILIINTKPSRFGIFTYISDSFWGWNVGKENIYWASGNACSYNIVHLKTCTGTLQGVVIDSYQVVWWHPLPSCFGTPWSPGICTYNGSTPPP